MIASRIKWKEIEEQYTAFLKNNPTLELNLYAAWKCGKLLEFIEGCNDFDLVDTIEKRADFLVVLFQRPLFDETARLARILGAVRKPD